ncbi:MAG: AHH domain-containing protein [Eubacterium sp.]|nr:AHH domain-containing protein [Eubacterium sp.]
MDAMDIVHGILDVAGFIPKYGCVADLLNAAIYGVEGKWEKAALSVVAAIPGIGDMVAVTAKALPEIMKMASIVKSVNWAKKAEWALAKAKKMAEFFTAVYGKAKTGARKIVDKINRARQIRRLKKAEIEKCKNKPIEEHHIMAYGNKKFAHQMLQIVKKYGIKDLKKDALNKIKLPHRGKHTDKYHEWMLDNLRKIDKAAKGRTDVFLKGFNKLREKLEKHPEILYKKW